MKLKPEHYAIIRDAVKCVATPQKVTGHRKQIEKDIAASGRQMDGDRRLRWDCLYAARLGPWLSKNVYHYANDEHIDMALRRIVGEIEQAAREMGCV